MTCLTARAITTMIHCMAASLCADNARYLASQLWPNVESRPATIWPPVSIGIRLLQLPFSWLTPRTRAVQKSDLARMYRLFNRVDKGLVPVADTFKKHVEAQGTALVKEVTDAMEAKKTKDAGTGGVVA